MYSNGKSVTDNYTFKQDGIISESFKLKILEGCVTHIVQVMPQNRVGHRS